ncbi:hypothetical protein [Herbidospora cretacea]|uniref:hypothetical protein n=1 Tax=Herbidospora cretacea TaxID=28444 RepID=UPI000774A61B|nr:hypothetical protein [Herbidospora cretacea]
MSGQDGDRPDPAGGAPRTDDDKDDKKDEELKYEDDGRLDESGAFSAREREQRQENLRRLHQAGGYIGANFTMPGDGARAYSADNINIFGAGPEERPQSILLSQDELDRLAPEHVASCETLVALDTLVPGAVLGTWGPPGSGRKTVALAGLVRFARRQSGGANVALLHVGDNPRRLRAGDLTAGTAYLVDAGSAEWTRTRNEAIFLHLVRLAQQTKTAIVVVLSDRALLTPEQRARYVHAHVAPSAIEVFERCLVFGLRHEDPRVAAAARTLAANPRVRAELGPDARPGEGAALAHAFLSRIRAGARPEDILDDVLDEQPQRLRERAAGLLRGTDPQAGESPAHHHRRLVYQRSFLLALAVLDRMPLTVVNTVAVRLAEMTAVPAPERLTGDELWSAFDQMSPDWLKYAQAEIDDGWGPWDRRVRFRDAHLGGKILEAAWQDHPLLREPFMVLLEGLCQNADLDVRMAGAQAVGKLATFDYAEVEARFLRPWIASNRVLSHWSAAWALESAAFEPRFAVRVKRQLLSWATESLARRSVAVRAFGTTLGLTFIDDALLGLRRIAASPALSRAVVQSLHELFVAGAHVQVVTELSSWARSGDERLAGVAAETLRWLAPARAGAGDELPLLLTMLADGDRPELVVHLWRNAIAEPLLRGRTWTALLEWVGIADDNPHLIGVVGGLVADLAQDPPVRHALRFYMTWWGTRAISRQTTLTLLAYLDGRDLR